MTGRAGRPLSSPRAAANVSRLSVAELDQYEAILNRETIDIFNYITEKDPTPPEIDGTIMTELKEYCATSPLGKASPAAYEEAKAKSSLT